MKSLKKILIKTGKIVSGTLGAGALVTILGYHAHKASSQFPTNMISGVESKFKTGKDNKYKIESQKIYDDILFTWDISKTDIDTSKYLPIAFSKKSEGKREYDMGTGETNIVPGPAYVPRKIKETSLSLEDIDIYEEPLSFTKEGKNKIRTAQSTNQNLHFNIETMDMNKNGRYFFPHVEKEDTISNALPFYLIPFNKSKLTIKEACKNISLSNSKQGIYRPVLIKNLNINAIKPVINRKKIISSPGKVQSK